MFQKRYPQGYGVVFLSEGRTLWALGVTLGVDFAEEVVAGSKHHRHVRVRARNGHCLSFESVCLTFCVCENYFDGHNRFDETKYFHLKIFNKIGTCAFSLCGFKWAQMCVIFLLNLNVWKHVFKIMFRIPFPFHFTNTAVTDSGKKNYVKLNTLPFQFVYISYLTCTKIELCILER